MHENLYFGQTNTFETPCNIVLLLLQKGLRKVETRAAVRKGRPYLCRPEKIGCLLFSSHAMGIAGKLIKGCRS